MTVLHARTYAQCLVVYGNLRKIEYKWIWFRWKPKIVSNAAFKAAIVPCRPIVPCSNSVVGQYVGLYLVRLVKSRLNLILLTYIHTYIHTYTFKIAPAPVCVHHTSKHAATSSTMFCCCRSTSYAETSPVLSSITWRIIFGTIYSETVSF